MNNYEEIDLLKVKEKVAEVVEKESKTKKAE